MPGFLDDMLAQPSTQFALGLMGGNGGNLGQRLLGATNYMQQQGDAAQRRQLMRAQMNDYQAQAETRRQILLQALAAGGGRGLAGPDAGAGTAPNGVPTPGVAGGNPTPPGTNAAGDGNAGLLPAMPLPVAQQGFGAPVPWPPLPGLRLGNGFTPAGQDSLPLDGM